MTKHPEEIFRQLLNEFRNSSPAELRNELPSELLRVTETILRENLAGRIEAAEWHRYLDLTRAPYFLKSLDNNEERYRWAETVFQVIKISNYTLLNLMEQRIAAHPAKPLFISYEGEVKNEYSYRWVDHRIKKIATAFLYVTDYKPKVIIYSENSVDSACCDIACLLYDIQVSPINIHFGAETLEHIQSKIGFNIAVTDTEHRLEILKELRDKSSNKFEIFYTGSTQLNDESIIQLDQILSLISHKDILGVLNKRQISGTDDTATYMFTSGSTGLPKGVAFTSYNIISKRFARAAALPDVGTDEVLLCYLPLFHTFGRYLEMMGTIFWGGTYVFAGKNDFDSLIGMIKKVQPTGLVSIPLRWKQLYEYIRDRLSGEAGKKTKFNMYREIAGENLRWGLSAAGYLEPKVFKFFNSYGTALCSGFGMTEATGGISMTPPGEYVTDSVGVPLPGIDVRLTGEGELKISGHYVAKYLDDIQSLKPSDGWLSTGDLFKQDENGFLYIIDRVKDIYKNIKGQTIAPAYVEKKFENIPGLKRAFLVGDMKPYNTLLVVPDYSEPFIEKARSQNRLREYFSSIVATVNMELSPYERILKFTLLERNFEESLGELTAKGTFKRKIIEKNFQSAIDNLYKNSQLKIDCGGVKITVPFWMIKDLGVTEGDIERRNNHLYNRQTRAELMIEKIDKSGRIRIGDFEYSTNREEVDLGLFARQPILWLGNKSLTSFAVCKEDWDTDFTYISSQVFIPDSIKRQKDPSSGLPNVAHFDLKLIELHETIISSLFGTEEVSLNGLLKLEMLLKTSEHKVDNLISRRIEALAFHPKFSVRSSAYKILLLNQPSIDYNRYLPTFITSGLNFLSKKTIEEIGYNKIEGFRLHAFSRRLEAYRKGLRWPVSENELAQFKRILDMLAELVHHNPESYSVIRAELISWILHEQDKRISNYAKNLFRELSIWKESRIKQTAFEKPKANWEKKIIFDETIILSERERLITLLADTTFVREAFLMLFDGEVFNLKEVQDKGIYISKIGSSNQNMLYRMSVNLLNFKHYDIVIFIKPGITRQKVLETIYLTIKIAHKSSEAPILPRLGNFRSKLGVISFEFINDLTVWERIRQLTSAQSAYSKADFEREWEILFKRGMAAFFTVLKNSDYKIIPGNISPSNAAVPEPQFREGTKILSISGWKKYTSPLDLITPLINNFYVQTFSNYPWSKEHLTIRWIFDACLEGLGENEGRDFLNELRSVLRSKDAQITGINILPELNRYVADLSTNPFVNSYILSAVKNYADWTKVNGKSTKRAKADFVQNLYSMYRADRYPELLRYIFYSRTYFSNLPDEEKTLLDKVILSLYKYPEQTAIKRVELVELQDLLEDKIDREVLNRLIFPKLAPQSKLQLAAEEKKTEAELLVKTEITDSLGLSYTVRKPVSPAEIGALNKLFILDSYPLKMGEDLKYLVVTDKDEEYIVGGVCYKILYANIAHIEGIEVARSYRGRKLAGRLIEDLCERLYSEGIKTVTTHFYLKSFFERLNFKIDSRYGGLVRLLKS